MVRFFLNRPIAVFLGFIVAILMGLFLFQKIPVSLLPNIDVPQIVIKVNYPNASSALVEENIIRNMREQLVTLDQLLNVESQSTNQSAILNLTFEYGTRMDLAYIAVNEALDRLSNSLPKDLPRPQVMRVNTSDIPIVNLQVIPKESKDYVQIADLTQKVIKKRIEQIEGVSIVDINGKQDAIIAVQLKIKEMAAVGLESADIEQAIIGANADLGSLSVKDGQYRFFVRLANKLESSEQIKAIPLRLKDGTITTVGRLSIISSEIAEPQGYHLLNGKEGLVITIQKQANSRMNELLPKINAAVEIFRKDYPQVELSLTQDQTFLLDQGIQNLTQDLWFGGIFCVILLFLFLGNYASPLLMSISIPVSLLLTFIFFYFFKISFNIISLSGLALGIGMLIDNSIVVLDSITRRRREGLSIDESCVLGVRDVISPVISNVLTTVAIYAPLVYMSGLAGALVYDQAIALTISLAVSLLVAFCLNPVMYKYFLKTPPEKLREDTRFYLTISKGYHNMIYHIFRHKKTYFLITILIMPLGFILFKFVPVTSLPKITEIETQIKLDWNSSIDAKENAYRVQLMGAILDKNVKSWEADIGIKQFLWRENNNTMQQADIYYKCASESQKHLTDKMIDRWLKNNYPNANWSITASPNAFTQLFENRQPYLEARFRSLAPVPTNDYNRKIDHTVQQIKANYTKGINFVREPNIDMSLDYNKMSLYGISKQGVENELERLFGSYNISAIKRFGDSKLVNLKANDLDIQTKLRTQIKGVNGAFYELLSIIIYTHGSSQRFIIADKSGVYQSINFQKSDIKDIDNLQEDITKVAGSNDFSVTFSGSYLTDRALLEDMTVIFIISLLLLYFILAVQFENLVHPFLVMLTIPLGIGGAMLVLWLAGGTLNIMTAIGFVVVLGIIVDDPSLKVETINRLRQEYQAGGMKDKKEILLKALHDAGEICLKPLLMVSLTTSLALVPVLFSGGIGNDLQRPLVYVIIGGLTIGTFFTLWFIPLAYWFITRKGD